MKNFRNKKFSNTKSWQKGKKKPLFKIRLPKIPELISRKAVLAAIAWLVLASNSNRKNMHKRKGGKKFLLLLAGIAAMILAVYSLLFADYFAIKNISVTGNQSIVSEKIIEITKGEFSGKIYDRVPAGNYFAADINKLGSRIKNSFTEIESVEIRKIFPDKLSITVKEKNPALMWCRQNCYFLNDQGIAILPANEGDMISANKKFIKIIEQTAIPEEAGEEEQIIDNDDEIDAQTNAPANEGNSSSQPLSVALNIQNPQPNSQDQQTAGQASGLLPINLNDQISDENFIKFALDINNILVYNSKLNIKFYKTKGTKTRELIAFTDKNIRLYFNATKNAKKQANNLSYFLEKGIEKDKIDSLRYIYLKNEDRVFYK